jgi:hypothetical protein
MHLIFKNCQQLEELSVFDSEPELVAIKNLKVLTPNLDINWLDVINNHILSTSKLTQDDEILVENPEEIEKFAKFLEIADRK